MEKEIAAFLSRLTEDEVSVPTSRMIKSLYRIASELESLGDSGECISRILNRLRLSEAKLSEDRLKGISHMLVLLRSAYDTMVGNIRLAAEHDERPDLKRALADEMSLNSLRDKLRDEEFARIERGNQSDFASSALYLDTISEIERMGDYIINISQSIDSIRD